MPDENNDNIEKTESTESKRKVPNIAQDDFKKSVAKISVSFDPKKITDLKYIFNIFSPEYDKFKSLDYIEKMHADLIKQGYPQTPILNEYLFWSAISRRMQISYQEYYKEQMNSLGKNMKSMINIEDKPFLKSMQDIAEHVSSLQESLDSSLMSTSQVKDVVDLHKDTCERAVKFLKAHFGEYVKRNPESSKITDITDKAYWAFAQDTIAEESGVETISYVWSEELQYLVNKKLIPIEYMAFALRTSIESLKHTAEIRKDTIELSDIEKAEKKLKEMMLEFEEMRHEKDKTILEKNNEIG